MSEEKVGGSLLKERIAEHIAKNIQNGIYVPGEKINEETIASQFFVSRTPVREVLAMLCSNGFIDKVPNKGYYVRELDRHTMNETYELIGILDFCCAKKALPYLEKEDFLKMEEYIAKMDLAIKFENFPDYVDNQAAFHQQYILKCHNSVLIKTIENLLRSPMPVTYTPKQYHEQVFSLLKRANSEHNTILKSLQSNDMALLEKTISNHWEDYANIKSPPNDIKK